MSAVYKGQGVKVPKSKLTNPKPYDLGVGRVKSDKSLVEARRGGVANPPLTCV